MNNEEIRNKIRRIADGIPFNLGNMTILTNDSDKLYVTGWTDTIYFENISKKKLLQELKELKSSFSNLYESFSELSDIIKSNNLTVEYHMSYNDAGKAGIGLCSELEGQIYWYIN